jgi:hypothetical protein
MSECGHYQQERVMPFSFKAFLITAQPSHQQSSVNPNVAIPQHRFLPGKQFLLLTASVVKWTHFEGIR